MPFAASCRAVVAALQRQDGVLTNSRLPCSTAENARVLYLRLLLFALVFGGTQDQYIRGAGRGMVAGTYLPHSTAEWWPGSFPVGLEGLSTDFSSPCFRTLGEQDEGSWRLFIPSLPSAWPRFSSCATAECCS